MKNKYKTNGDTTVIYCESPEGVVEVYIDTTDLPLLLGQNWTWRASYRKSKKMYVFGNNLALHRFLTGAKRGSIIDHRDRNPLNNRRSNLRTVNPMESVRNRDVFKNSTSGYPGVNWSSQYKKWKAKLRLNGKDIYLGRYDNLEDAIEARKAGEIKYWQ